MSVTLGSYIESMMHGCAGFRTLAGICPRTDSSGRPLFTAGSRTVAFSVSRGGADFLLRCPLAMSVAERVQAEKYSMESVRKSNPFIAACDYLRGEMLVFDGAGRAVWQDVILEELPAGVPLARFVRSVLFASGRRPFRLLLQSVARMAESLADAGMVHGNLRPENIFADAEGTVKAANYALSADRDPKSDIKAFASLAASLFVTACEPSLFGELGGGKSPSPSVTGKNYKHILAQAEFLRLAELAELLKAADSRTEMTRSELHSALNALCATPFAPMPLLAELIAGESGKTAVGIRTAAPVKATEQDDATLLVDFRRCEYVGDVSDTIIRFRERGAWGFADRYGRRLTSEGFLDAGDFYEGRAAVETHSGWGLIDRRGGYVMPPRFESLEWHGAENVVSACADGKWELYGRDGRQLTTGMYDWIGDCSEGAFVARRGNRFGYLRADGTALTGMRFDDAYSFRDGKAMVRLGNETYHIDTDGYRIPLPETVNQE